MLEPTVVILMATYNGQKYLAEQIESIRAQTYPHWKILVSDDGSHDNTHHILKYYQELIGKQKFLIYSGPNKGFAINFLSLILKEDAIGDYYAYSDQDDIWEPNKLEIALAWLKQVPAKQPALYCSRTKLIDEKGQAIGYSPLFKRKPSFQNALIQNIAGGNTMVYNHAASNLLRCIDINLAMIAHDWWTYLLIAGAGGIVYYDPIPTLQYRQHASNIIGVNSSWKARLSRIGSLFQGRFQRFIDTNIQALIAHQKLLTEENQIILKKFITARNASMIYRIIGIKKIGIYRQTFLGNIGLTLAIFCKKI